MTKWTMAYRELFVLTSLVILLPTLVGALCWREFVWFPLGLLATHWLVLFFILRDHANAAQSPRILRLIFWLLPFGRCVKKPALPMCILCQKRSFLWNH